MKLKFNLTYFSLAALVFVIEILIATILKDIFVIRAYLGDVLVVMLLYYFIKAFFTVKNDKNLISIIFVFAVIVEILQYFHFAEFLGFKNNIIAMTVLGNSFSWIDILCYFLGCLILYFFQILNRNENNCSNSS